MRYALQIKPTRAALIIGSPGIEGVDYLYSVSRDITNIKDHLLSSRGGKWQNKEIKVLWDIGLAELTIAIQNTAADYLFIYFAGHGYESGNGERKICLKDADVSDLFLLNNSPRQLIIIDACREKEYPAISGIDKEEEWLPFDGYYPEREAFDNYILQSPIGKKIVHATKSGYAAYEDKGGRGGIFTTNLILSARNILCNEVYAPIGIEQSLKKTRKMIKQAGDEQEPEIVYAVGNLQVPFALYFKNEPKLIYSDPGDNKARSFLRKESSDSGALAFGLVILGIALIASSSDS